MRLAVGVSDYVDSGVFELSEGYDVVGFPAVMLALRSLIGIALGLGLG